MKEREVKIYKINVLRKAEDYLKRGVCQGMCPALRSALEYYGIKPPVIKFYIEKYSLKNARWFGAKYKYNGYWWTPGKYNWRCGRYWYMQWLKWKYRKDKTILKRIYL